MLWKLHDVGQRLLLADKKTEEGRTVGGVVVQQRRRDSGGGVEGEGGDGKRSDRRLRGYFDELLRTHYLNPRPGVVARPATTPFVRRVMTEERELHGRIALSRRALRVPFTGRVHVHAKLI